LQAQAEATRSAILEELRKANEIELDAEARKAEAAAKRATALHKLLRDEKLVNAQGALPATVSSAFVPVNGQYFAIARPACGVPVHALGCFNFL